MNHVYITVREVKGKTFSIVIDQVFTNLDDANERRDRNLSLDLFVVRHNVQSWKKKII